MSEDVTNHGAVPNDNSNDTQAFIDAAEAANGGEIYVPEGEFTLDSKRWTGGALHFGDKGAYQPSGTSIVGAGADKTVIKMEGGHTNNYQAFVYHESGNHDGAVVRDLTLDGNQWNQGSSSDMPNGFAVQVNGSSQDMLLENCRMIDWSLTGGGYGSRNVVIRNCEFINNGQAVLDTNGYRGHGLNVSNDASSVSDSGVLVEACYFGNNAGNSVDNNGGNLTIRRCFSENNGLAVKFNDSVRTTIENSRFRNIQWRGVKTVGQDDHNELTELYDVELSSTGYEAIASRTTGRFEGHNILISDANKSNFHNGEAVRFENKSVDIGTLAVSDTSNGSVFDVRNSSGKIDKLIHDNNKDGIGPTDGVSIGSKTAGGSLAITAPSKSEVGVSGSSSSDSSSTTSYDHLLEVQAAENADLTTYSVTVTGEAVVGDNSNKQESVTQLSNGNYLLEGQVATGGTDDFEFNGDIVKSESSIDGNATAYVDGSAVDLTVDTTPSYDHLLEVQAAENADLTTYSVTVTGEAVVGDNANMQESVTQLSNGNYLLEGQVASGGTDDFKFNGDIVKSESSIDGNATAYVDGSAVDLSSTQSRTYGDYTTPEPGTTDWHKPVNQNFEDIGQDVQDLLARIEELENKVN